MGTTKIIVVHLKQIIKSIIFLLIAFALIALLIINFIPKNNIYNPDSKKNNKAKARAINSLYIPGDYFSQIILHSKPVKIQVSVDQNKILAIKLNDINKSQEVFYPLLKPTLEKISREIIQYQSLDIPIKKDSVFTEKILLDAVDNALQKAKTKLY